MNYVAASYHLNRDELHAGNFVADVSRGRFRSVLQHVQTDRHTAGICTECVLAVGSLQFET